MSFLRSAAMVVLAFWAGSGCLREAPAPSSAAPASSQSPRLALSIVDARLDSRSGYIMLLLKFAATQGTVLVDTYCPEYAVSLNGGPFGPSAPIRWRCPFDIGFIVPVSEGSPHAFVYHCKAGELPAASVKTIRVRMSRRDENERLVSILRQRGYAEVDQYAHTWSGTVASNEFVVEHLDRWHGEGDAHVHDG